MAEKVTPRPGPGRTGDVDESSDRWSRRPVLARAMGVLILVAPALVAFFVTWGLGRRVTHIDLGIARWQYIVAMLAVAIVVVLATERVMRRLLPLVALLNLQLVFPDRAPKRFKVAMRSHTTKQLQRRIDEIQAGHFEVTPETNQAELMLELVAALSAHDKLTRGHCERVRAYSDMIIEQLDIDENDANQLRWSALLHDVGKLRIPFEILNKKGTLTYDEFEIIKTHPLLGLMLTESLADWLGEWRAAVDQHHERWDGDGYPYGLATTDIHLGARIVAVADAYDVMTSARSYKTPMSPHDARKEIQRCAGSHFDPEIVRAFLNIGVGRLRLGISPLATLLNIPAAATQQLAPVLAPVATGAAGLAALGAAAITGLALPPDDTVPPDQPPIAAVESTDTLPPLDTTTTEPEPTTSVDTSSSSAPSSTTTTTAPTSPPPPPPPPAPTTAAPPPTTTSPPAPPPPPTTAPPPTTTAPTPLTLSPATLSLDEDTTGVAGITTTGQGTITLRIIAQPANGTARFPTLAGGRQSVETTDGVTSIEFVPNQDFNGVDQIGVEACDASGTCVQALVPITVRPVQDSPTAGTASWTGSLCTTSASIDLAPLVSDVDGDPVTIVDVTVEAGTVTVDTSTLPVVTIAGDIGAPSRITYTAEDSGGNRTTGQIDLQSSSTAQLYWNTNPDPAVGNGGPLQGATVASSIVIYFDFGCGDGLIEAVDFWIDGVFERRETLWPFSISGDGGPGSPVMGYWNTTEYANGQHLVMTSITTTDGRTLTPAATFTIAN